MIPANDDADKSVALIVGLLADAIVEAKGGLPVIAFVKEDGEDVTMKDVLRQADRENALRIAARREMQRERLEKERAHRNQFDNRGDRQIERKSAENKDAAPVVANKAEEGN